MKAKSRIAFLREKAGLTQLELSRLVDVTENTVQNWERGRAGIEHIERVIRFCQALNCQVEDLIEYVPNTEPPSVPKPSLAQLRQQLDTDKPSKTSAIKSEVSGLKHS